MSYDNNPFYETKYLFIGIIVVLSLIVVYFNTPALLDYIYSNEGLELASVTCPEQIYRTDGLQVNVEVKNIGSLKKSVLVKVFSMDGPTQSNWTTVDSENTISFVTLKIPVSSIGQQSFSIRVYWAGPLGISNIKQDNHDVISNILAAEYSLSSSPNYASISENFNLNVQVENIGNVAAEKLEIIVLDKGQMSIFQPDSVTLDNFRMGEEKTVTFRFTVPYDAKEGKETVSIEFKTHYPTGVESSVHKFDLNLQKGPSQVQLENVRFWLTSLIAVVTAVSLLLAFAQKRR